MKQKLAFGALLLATSQLIAPAALAQGAGSTGQDTPPAPAETTGQTEEAAPEEGQEAVDVSAPGAGEEQEIVVRGRNIPNVVKNTPQVVSVLSTADIARTGEGDIAGALQRVTGLSVVGNGFVYVRGLGDRYSSALLNGSPLPSPEPLRRAVPLDIFPTNVIASALVQKSYSANYPAEFGGGVINLTTRAVPKAAFIEVEGSLGIDTVTTREIGYVYDGGAYDWTGFDDGERRVPGYIVQAGRNRTTLASRTITSLSNAQTTLLQEQSKIPPNWSASLNLGTPLDVGAVRLGVLAAGSFSNTWRTRASNQQYSTGIGALDSDFDTVLTDNRSVTSGLFGLSAEFGEHVVRFTNVYVHDTVKQGRLSAGNDANNGIDNAIPTFIEQNTNWFERELFTNQLAGEFKFDDLRFEFRGARAKTKRESPYERFFTYQYNNSVRDYVNALTGLQRASVNFSDLNETLWSGSADVAYDLPFDRAFTILGGYAYSDTVRDSSRFTFRYTLPGGTALPQPYAQLRPDYLLSDYNIVINNIVLQPTSTGLGATEYRGTLRTHAGYLQVDTELFDGYRASVGVRYETARQSVITTAPIATLDNGYWLPAVTLTYNFAQNMQVRLHGSKTIARPQFRELAPQEYQDFDSDRLFFGNPYLVDSELYNFDARAEWFFARDQRLTVAAFWKRIDNPIEAVSAFVNQDSRPQTGFSYVPRAKLYGAEVELVKYFPLSFLGDWTGTYRLLVIANYTYSKSEIEANGTLVPNAIQILGTPIRRTASNLLFRDGEPLTGQSDHLVNFQIGIEDPDSLSALTFLVNYASDRVVARGPIVGGGAGAVFQPDIVESPGVRFDLVLRQGFEAVGTEFELKMEARNLSGVQYREFQKFDNGNTIFLNRYDQGRTFSIGLSARF
jgi:TonB-dependent receptor